MQKKKKVPKEGNSPKVLTNHTVWIAKLPLVIPGMQLSDERKRVHEHSKSARAKTFVNIAVD